MKKIENCLNKLQEKIIPTVIAVLNSVQNVINSVCTELKKYKKEDSSNK